MNAGGNQLKNKKLKLDEINNKLDELNLQINKIVVNKENSYIIMATHSTAIVGALQDYDYTRIEFMKAGQVELNFKEISKEYRKVLPIFGAHPLSNIFNKTPIFLVEGDDDERIWQQAVRSSEGKLRIYPCSTDSINCMHQYEQDVENIIGSIYDNATLAHTNCIIIHTNRTNSCRLCI